MRLRTLTRWLTIVLWGGFLTPVATWGQEVSPAGMPQPLPKPLQLAIGPQEKGAIPPEQPAEKPAAPAPAADTTPKTTPPPSQGVGVPGPVAPLEIKPGMMLPSLPGQVMGTNVHPVLEGGMPPLSESAVSTLDSALIASQLRLRLDGRFSNTRPDRSAYIMAKTQEFPLATTTVIPLGNGLPLSERKISMEVLSLYGEYACCERISVFGELPIRSLQADVNGNATNVSDVSFGAKVAIFALPDLVQTIQCRVICPTGDTHEGMGSGIFAIEPGFLVYNRLTPRWTLEGEIRDWMPIGEPDFAGNVLRYGLEAAYDLTATANGWSVRPVFGLWGVAFLKGRQTVIGPTGPVLEDARERILNGEVGIRVGGNGSSFFLGYSQVLTGSALFEHEVRLEWRYSF
jgi:hypothetical protein